MIKGRGGNGKPVSGQRNILATQLPLKAPYLIQMFPIYACNFKCGYCLFSIDKDQHSKISESIEMSMDLYETIMNNITEFQTPIKMLRFAGIGEPLLHPNIDEMVRIAKETNMFGSIDIVTNGSMLSNKMSLKLIEAGLDWLRVSIQGVTTEKYKEICQASIDIKELADKIGYFYDNKKQCKVYVKIIDCALDSDSDVDAFYKLFEDKCDVIAIEHMTDTTDGVNYDKFAREKNRTFTQNGAPIINSDICPQPFYMMQINPDGKVVPCCSMKYPKIMGNLNNHSPYDIWSGSCFNDFRRGLLDGVKNGLSVCKACELYKYGMYEEDCLDNYVDLIKERY